MPKNLNLLGLMRIILIASILLSGFATQCGCKKQKNEKSWLNSLHEEGRKIFHQTIKDEIEAHPERNILNEMEIKKIRETETRYERLYEILINIFYLKDEPIFRALLKDGSEKAKSRFKNMYLELAHFSAHQFIECFFLIDPNTEYAKRNYPTYKGMDAVDLVIRSIGYQAKLDIPETEMFANPVSPEFDKQGALDAARFRSAHKITRAKGVKIAILDTGIDMSHSIFKNTKWGKHFSLVGRLGPPWTSNAPLVDWGWHGTLISSIATRYAPEARLTMYKNGDGDTQNDPAYQYLMECILAAIIYKAVHDGNDVISISASGLSLDSEYMRNACQYAYVNNRVVISGNLYHRWQLMGNNLNFPGQYETVISVTAAEKKKDGTYGYWDVCAPDPTTTIAAPHDIFGGFPTFVGEKDTYVPSISAAIPTVAALAAMTISVYPRMGTEAPGEYSETIRKLIIENANPEKVGFDGFSPECGYGMIDAEKTVKAAILLHKKRMASLGKK